jgi:hypothetical protein
MFSRGISQVSEMILATVSKVVDMKGLHSSGARPWGTN